MGAVGRLGHTGRLHSGEGRRLAASTIEGRCVASALPGRLKPSESSTLAAHCSKSASGSCVCWNGVDSYCCMMRSGSGDSSLQSLGRSHFW